MTFMRAKFAMSLCASTCAFVFAVAIGTTSVAAQTVMPAHAMQPPNMAMMADASCPYSDSNVLNMIHTAHMEDMLHAMALDGMGNMVSMTDTMTTMHMSIMMRLQASGALANTRYLGCMAKIMAMMSMGSAQMHSPGDSLWP
jgi:hypothetical protein